jgi:hypothetical protein
LNWANEKSIMSHCAVSTQAIEHCKELAQQFRDGSLLDDQDLERLRMNGRFAPQAAIGN